MDTPSIPEKSCSKCRISYPATREYFYAVKRSPDGLGAECKVCRREQQREYSDRPEVKTRVKTRNQTPEAKEHRREWEREYTTLPDVKAKRLAKYHTQEYKDYHNAIRRTLKYRAKNREADKRRQEYLRSYRSTDEFRERNRIKRQHRRAKEAEAGGKHTAADIQAQYKRQKGRCYYAACGHSKLKGKYHIEHVVPLDRNGRNAPDNIVLACAFCNLSKHTKLPHEWAEGGRLL